MPASAVAASAVSRFGQAADPVGLLVPLVAAVVFSPAEPEPAAADQAWHLYRQLMRGLYPHRSSPRRIAALVSPRALLATRHQAREARVTPRFPYRAQEGRR
jgi:hypothetical protein